MAKLPLVPLKSRIAAIGRAYAGAADAVVATLSSLDPETFTASKGGVALSRIAEIVGSLDSGVKRWARASISAAYKEGADVSRTRLEAIGASRLPARSRKAGRHERKIDALTRTVMKDYWEANRTIEKTARKYIALVGLAAQEVRKIEAFASDADFPYIKRIVKVAKGTGIAESQSRTAVSRKILEHLRRKLSGGDFIEINGRHYNLRAYSELVARTRMREAQTEATKEMCAEFENDLVEIPPHDNPCEECAPYQGQVYSISGNHPKYELLPDGGPPWHPHCEDVCNPTSENAQRLRNA
jgi:hypothetical protein